MLFQHFDVLPLQPSYHLDRIGHLVVYVRPGFHRRVVMIHVGDELVEDITDITPHQFPEQRHTTIEVVNRFFIFFKGITKGEQPLSQLVNIGGEDRGRVPTTDHHSLKILQPILVALGFFPAGLEREEQRSPDDRRRADSREPEATCGHPQLGSGRRQPLSQTTTTGQHPGNPSPNLRQRS